MSTLKFFRIKVYQTRFLPHLPHPFICKLLYINNLMWG